MAGAKLLVVLACFVAVCAARTRWHQLDGYTFEKYEEEFGRKYKSVEERAFRRGIFEAKLEKIKAHNNDSRFSWKEGVNHFTDRTHEEFKIRLGYDKSINRHFRANPASTLQMKRTPGFVAPDSVDWRPKGAVSAVKDQGDCGSCWSFAAASTLESQYAVKTGKLPVLSEQHILSCTPNPQECGGTGGCSGGTAELAYATINRTGMASEWTYPYTSYHGRDFACTFSPALTPPAVRFAGYVKLPENQYEPLIEAVATLGPIAISVEAVAWSGYEEGVFDGCNQNDPDIDHAVQLVGYGTDAATGKDYWIVRNSWSPEWGEEGFIRVLRTSAEQTRCGVDTKPSDGSGCKGGPPTVTVCGTCGILYDTCYPTF